MVTIIFIFNTVLEHFGHISRIICINAEKEGIKIITIYRYFDHILENLNIKILVEVIQEFSKLPTNKTNLKKAVTL